MKKIIIKLFGIPFLIYGLTVPANAQTDSVYKANVLIRVEQSLCDALPGDSLLWSRYLDPHWYAITEDGSGFFKKEFLQGFSAFSKGFSGNIRVTHPVCLFHDSIAVIHYVADENELVFGQKLHTTYAVMDTWYQTRTSWVMLSMQIFEIPQLPVAVRTEASTLKMYAGVYELGENKTAKVSVRNDSLIIQRNNHDPEVLFREMNNIFFVLNDSRGRKIFVKDGSGKMTMIERRNGQDLVWKKK